MLMPVVKKVVVVTSFFLIPLVSFNATAKMSGLPDFTHLVEEYSDAVVNISTTQKIKKRNGLHPQIPGFPKGSPFEDLFRRFFEQQSYKKIVLQIIKSSLLLKIYFKPGKLMIH